MLRVTIFYDTHLYRRRSPGYFVQSRLFVFGCPNLTAGSCTGPVELSFQHLCCTSPNARLMSNRWPPHTSSLVNLVVGLVIILVIRIIIAMRQKYVGVVRKQAAGL